MACYNGTSTSPLWACATHDTRHTTHMRHVTYEWKIEMYDAADLSAGIIDVDHYDTLSEMLDAVERIDDPCQVCLVRDDDRYIAFWHLYFVERTRFDEDERGAPLKHAREIVRNKTRIAALVAAGRILTDAQIGVS